MTSEVSKHFHVDHPQHSVELENTEVLTTEPRWFVKKIFGGLFIMLSFSAIAQILIKLLAIF